MLTADKTKGEIRDHRYRQQKRLEHERAMNKYTGKLQEKKHHNKFHNKCNLFQYQEITNQFDFKSAHQKESH